jgi:WD40 repeat protein
MTLELSCSLPNIGSEVFSLRYSLCGDSLLATSGDGKIRVFNAAVGAEQDEDYDLLASVPPPIILDSSATSVGEIGERDEVPLPCTSLWFRPAVASSSGTSGLFAATYSDGRIQHWHLPSQKLLRTNRVCMKDGRTCSDLEALCITYPSESASHFAVGASDGLVRSATLAS